MLPIKLAVATAAIKIHIDNSVSSIAHELVLARRSIGDSD
jgi:hypothetical protein